MARGDPVCSKQDCSPYDIGLVLGEIGNYSPQDKMKFTESVWKPVVIRFLDTNKTIREEFIGYYLCEEGTTGEAIKDIIIPVGDLGLTMEDCHGQCYDGAGNMAGRLNGASSLIRAEHEKAIYVHCMNHRLNLCIANTCQLPIVRNMMDIMMKLQQKAMDLLKAKDQLALLKSVLGEMNTNIDDKHHELHQEAVALARQARHAKLCSFRGRAFVMGEIMEWKGMDHRGDVIPDSLEATLEDIDKDAYVNIYFILKVLITIPISSTPCERSISSLRNLKNYLRNTMTQDRLNGLALMHAHSDMDFDLDRIIDLFAEIHPSISISIVSTSKTVVAVLDQMLNPYWSYLPKRQENYETEEEREAIEGVWNTISDAPLNCHFYYHILDGDEGGPPPKILASDGHQQIENYFNWRDKSCLHAIAMSNNKEALHHPVVRMVI
ncbi:52 kDa repressor of the inhibitor of the protein kinase [Stylophora pistillata]|uniref:52 kDa repressor of the inhibitor of the protein kinase n=1 Tax=Stylophora pistillata TaxID=50429 RepID=A0A2B4RFE0_STYPI|nr:52 kDa repressor of the inhibitor of the protein kinase [Stylophora pistillata]